MAANSNRDLQVTSLDKLIIKQCFACEEIQAFSPLLNEACMNSPQVAISHNFYIWRSCINLIRWYAIYS